MAVERDVQSCVEAAESVDGLGIVTGCAGMLIRWMPHWLKPSPELGPVRILVNNAGGVFASPLLETTENGWDALLPQQFASCAAVHATGRLLKLVAAELPGSIINVTSIEGVRAAPGYAACVAGEGRRRQLHADRGGQPAARHQGQCAGAGPDCHRRS